MVMRYLFYFLLFSSFSATAQYEHVKCIIWDTNPAHAEIPVERDWVAEYGDSAHVISLLSTIADFKMFADSCPNLEVVVRSVMNYPGHTQLSLDLWADSVLLFMPYGGNSYTEGSSVSPDSIIITGAGNSSLFTTFGEHLFVWDEGANVSSTTATIAAKFLKLKETTDTTWQAVKETVQLTASNGGVDEPIDGYGKINYSAAENTLVPSVRCVSVGDGMKVCDFIDYDGFEMRGKNGKLYRVFIGETGGWNWEEID